jgi:pyruvate/2-oxoglutarate dehydrogenase complex dihydrolipoamide dehydrogenase (E3) component
METFDVVVIGAKKIIIATGSTPAMPVRGGGFLN